MPVKRGLVAPQNTFIQTIIKKFDGSPDRNFVLGNAQADGLPIIYCNEGFCELTGYSRAELVQRNCSCDFLCGQGTNEVAKQDVKNALKGTVERHIEILYYRKDGSPFLCSVLVAPVKDEAGRVSMYIVNHEDVTWSPNRDDVINHTTCFNFTKPSRHVVSFKRRNVEKDERESLESGSGHYKKVERPNSLPTSSANSTVQSPEFIPLMSIHPPTPPECSEEPDTRSLLPDRRVSSSLNNLHCDSPGMQRAELFMNDSTRLPPHSLAAAFRPDADNLFLPIKPQIASAASDTTLWKTRSQHSSDQNMDMYNSMMKLSPNLQPVIQQGKREKVAQVMSLGADVLPEYKLQAPNIHPWTILHYSVFKAFWDWLILFLVIYTAIVTPYMASFILTRDKMRDELNKDPETRRDYGSGAREVYSDPLVILDYLVDVMFIVDIFINFRTTFVDSNDEVVSHPCRIAVHYFKTWFVIDLMAAIPFELLIMVGNTDETTTLIGLLKTARLLRLVRVARKLDHYSEYGMAVLCLLMCSFALLAHWLACIWYAIGNLERQRTNSTHGWLDVLAEQIHRPFDEKEVDSGPDIESKYITALYFTLSSLTSVGFGNVSPNTNAEKIFSICVMLIGSLFYAAIFGNVAAIIARLYSNTARYHAQMQRVREFIRFHQIPNPLRQRIEDYSHHIWSYTNGIDMDQVLGGFPECLQADICLHLNANVLTTYRAFTSASQGCLRSLALKLRTTHLPPGDFIIYQGDEISHLYFLVRGTVEVLKDDTIMAILGKGDSFGENFGLSPNRPPGNSHVSIRALTYCDLRAISRDDLVNTMRMYPNFQQTFNQDLEITYLLREREGAGSTKELNSSCNSETLQKYTESASSTPVVQQTPKGVDCRHTDDAASDAEDVGNESSCETCKSHNASGEKSSEFNTSCGFCRDCMCGMAILDSTVQKLSSRLDRLESKLSSDVESICELIRSLERSIRVVRPCPNTEV
uniref:Erg1 n=2 Tax=Nematostella vectensis TaxID=45351 RepID=A0A023PIW1_NEMVE|nr:Erg1 [Nematostella vectensis]